MPERAETVNTGHGVILECAPRRTERAGNNKYYSTGREYYFASDEAARAAGR